MVRDIVVTPRVLADFAGVWHVERVISHVSGPDAQFRGVATWTHSEEGMRYVEVGTLSLAGHPSMQAERRYVWGDDLTVYFDDGRFFHRVPERGGEVRHWCDPDMYTLTYDFSCWPDFNVKWQVSGPRKDYLAQTYYRKQSA